MQFSVLVRYKTSCQNGIAKYLESIVCLKFLMTDTGKEESDKQSLQRSESMCFNMTSIQRVIKNLMKKKCSWTEESSCPRNNIHR